MRHFAAFFVSEYYDTAIMDSAIFFKGLIIGFSIAAPVGPIGVLCIRRTLAHGMPAGFLSGLGAATADALYGCVAGFGLALVADFFVSQQLVLRLVGGLFLVYLGYRTLRVRPADAPGVEAAGMSAEQAPRASLWGNYGSTLLLTLTNPLTILSFSAIFAGLGLASGPRSYGAAGLLVAGVFMGSASWWLLLSGGTSLLRQRLTPQSMRAVNILSGLVILGFGVAALVSLWGA